MTSFRRYLTILLAVLTLLGAAAPAYAAEEETLLTAESPVPTETGAPESDGEAEETQETQETETPTATETSAPQEAENPSATETPEPVADEAPTETETPAETEMPAETEATAPAEDSAALSALVWETPGNTTIEILGGGKMVSDNDGFYYSDFGIYKSDDNGDRIIAEVYEATNLNLSGDWLYFTDPNAGICRMSKNGGAVETVLAYDSYIEQMYVIGRELRFVADGNVYSYNMGLETLETLVEAGDILGLIPTEYGNITISGDPFERELRIDGETIFSAVESCYTDCGYLIIRYEGADWQIELASLFAGSRALESYSLYRDEQAAITPLTEEEAMLAETAFFESDEYAEQLRIEAQQMAHDGASTYASTVYTTALTNGKSDQNYINIALRAQQMSEVQWTALKDRYAWGGSSAYRTIKDVDGTVSKTYFVAGKTYRGIPYSQPWNIGGYVGYNLSIKSFVDATSNNSSKFYTAYNYDTKTAPYYGNDCSGFVSWAWNLNGRRICSGLGSSDVSDKIGRSVNLLKLGDCLDDCSSHVVLVSDIGYDASGNIVSVEITEQTPAKMKVSVYGAVIPGKRYDVHYSSLSSLTSNYFNQGYAIYRRHFRGSENKSVPHKESDSVGAGGYWAVAPSIQTETSSDGTGLIVTLIHASGNTIYYTIDGSTPTTSSTPYTEPILLTRTSTLKATIDPGEDYTGALVLSYSVKLVQAEKPEPVLVSGVYSNGFVQKDSYITLVSENGDSVYYTTDGSDPTIDSPKMTAAGIKISEDTTIKCFAFGKDYIRSDTVTYEIKLGEFYNIAAGVNGANGKISPSGNVAAPKGENFTFTITPNAGYKVRDVLVDGQSVGAVSSYTFNDITAEHSISVRFVIDLPFSDVGNAWFADAVAFAYTNNYFLGTSSSTFEPEAYMTRGMLVTVIGRYAGMKSRLEGFTNTLSYSNGYEITIRSSASTSAGVVGYISEPGLQVTITGSTTGSDGYLWYKVIYSGKTGWVRSQLDSGKKLLLPYEKNFKDLSKDYYYGYVQWAYLNDIINGRNSNSFAPNEYITRQDLCVVLYNYLTEYLGKKLSTTATKTFTDSNQINDWAVNAVNAMTNIGIISGHDDGRFGPRDYASRAQVAQILLNLENYLN